MLKYWGGMFWVLFLALMQGSKPITGMELITAVSAVCLQVIYSLANKLSFNSADAHQWNARELQAAFEQTHVDL